MTATNRSRRMALALMAAVALISALAILASRHPAPQANPPPMARVQSVIVPSNSSARTVVAGVITSVPAATNMRSSRAVFLERPFPVAYESSSSQWTQADGKDTNVIRQLAHNPLEFDRMVEENGRVFRRQLVYLKQTAAAIFEEARLTGKSVQQLTLPGLDGQEHQFAITQGDSPGTGRRGMFSGRLVGKADSLVTLAFHDGREAFTILSPSDHVYVVGEPREPGQVIVKAIDPANYVVGVCGNP